ncbi:hypothetical protein Taro_014765 [Colocasia esculenta]|uniref:Uncharacterized protein n=1 Tax=Colocasia esculenta TaxID=4460 RepID=A0A843UMT4_COLES|nr:hypothetical protein [Colocasia esculenta]
MQQFKQAELFRNCAGFYRQLEEEIEFNLEEADVKQRENGELFELRMALQLGRRPSELRTLSSSSPRKHGDAEHAGKLFYRCGGAAPLHPRAAWRVQPQVH